MTINFYTISTLSDVGDVSSKLIKSLNHSTCICLGCIRIERKEMIITIIIKETIIIYE